MDLRQILVRRFLGGQESDALVLRAGASPEDLDDLHRTRKLPDRPEGICLRLREAHTVLTDDRAKRLYDDKLFVAPRLKKRKTQRSRARKKAKLDAHPVMQKVKKGREYYQAAVEAKKAGKVLKADASLRLAIACDPQRQEYRDFAAALEGDINKQKARKVFERAREAALIQGVSEALWATNSMWVASLPGA